MPPESTSIIAVAHAFDRDVQFGPGIGMYIDWDAFANPLDTVNTDPRALAAAYTLMRCRHHWVYFVQVGRGGRIRVGASMDPARRRRQIQVTAPGHVNLLGAMPGGFAKERAVHRYFRPIRDHGDWFWPDPQLMVYIYRYAFIWPITIPESGVPLMSVREMMT